MPMDPNAAPPGAGAPPPPDQQSGQGPGGQSGPLEQMIMQTDQALTGLAKVLGKASPEAGQALAQLSEQFRAVITSVMNGPGQDPGGPGTQPASPMVSPETHGKPSMQAY